MVGDGRVQEFTISSLLNHPLPMAPLASATRLFLREFRREFHTTGAIAPSGRALSRALARFVAPNGQHSRPRQLLEVGPGTGSVTRYIVQDMQRDDSLCLVESNARFVAHLRQRFATEPDFQRVGAQTQIIPSRLEDLSSERRYDVIISGLPLNNFPPDVVETI